MATSKKLKTCEELYYYSPDNVLKESLGHIAETLECAVEKTTIGVLTIINLVGAHEFLTQRYSAEISAVTGLVGHKTLAVITSALEFYTNID